MKKQFICRAAAAAIAAALMLSFAGCSAASTSASAALESSSQMDDQTDPKPAEPSMQGESNAESSSPSAAPDDKDNGGGAATKSDEIRGTVPVDIGLLPHDEGDQYVLVKITALPSVNNSEQELNDGSQVIFEYDDAGNPVSKYKYYSETNQGLEQEYEYTDGVITGYTQYELDGTFAYRVEYGDLQPLDNPKYAYMRTSNKFDAEGKKDGRIEERLDSNLTVLYAREYDYLGRNVKTGMISYLAADERDIQYDSLGNLLTSKITLDAGRGIQYTTYIFEYQWLSDYLQNKGQ